MRRFFARVLAVIGGLALFAGLSAAGTAAYFWWTKPGVPAVAVLTIDLDRGLPEQRDQGPLSLLRGGGGASNFRAVIGALDRAAADARVKGLVAAIGSGSLGLAQTQELRAAIKRFRAAGKFAYAISDSFGEFGAGNSGYYLAAAFERIYLQPTGALGLTGFYAETPFARDALNEWGVEPMIDRRAEYKTAPNSATETGFTPAQRENLQALVDDLTAQAVRDIAQDRRLEQPALRALIDRGPFDAGQAKQAGLVDELAYRDQALDAARGKAGAEAKTMKLGRYVATSDAPKPKGDPVALVYAVGAITRGDGGQTSPLGGTTLGADRVAKAIEDATADEKVKAIVLRIDSPGGSYVASDTIRRAVERARAKGKPVVASMGNAAASGGYYIALAAERIVAEPATITGSIGVFAGKLHTSGFWRKLGVNWDGVAGGARADLWTQAKAYDADERAWLGQTLDRIYDEFVGRVAEARGLTMEQAREIAKGRVWTGSEAKQRGLVDELGGLDTAIAAARSLAGIAEDGPPAIREFPRQRNAAQRLLDRALGREEESSGIEILAGLEPLLALAQRVAGFEDTGVLAMPPLAIK